MKDNKQNQTEFCLKNTNTSFQVEELFDNLPNRLEMPFLRIKERERKKENVYKSLGWSLMAGINDHFMPCFCLQGIHGDFRNKLNYRNLRDEIVEDLVASAKFSFIEDEVSEALCILADTDHWKIELLSSSSVLSNTNNNPVMMSPLISEICESLTQMYLLDITPENCMMYLESRLQELYFRSLSLAEFVNNSSSIELDNIAKSLKLDPSDIPLLLAIVSRPNLALAY
ncbi:folliculin-interacting protein 1-like [Centruroides sculpturatus]|uniref:folliculin-interacting protein 1-like n=1 Tax=Centruroides sculpturatus TaxID=218467 RepID=UPI000C6DF08F|nr:folliculin-interacting protein 1-like [Centruroides sculpturatus]